MVVLVREHVERRREGERSVNLCQVLGMDQRKKKKTKERKKKTRRGK